MSSYSAGSSAIALNPGDSVFLFGVLGNAAIAAVGTPGASRTNGTTTITTSAAHNFVIGQRVKIAGVNSVAFGSAGDKAALYGFDGEYEILTVPSATTFTYSDLQKPNDTGGGGTATSIQAEQPALPQAGAQVSIIPRRSSVAAPAISFEVAFTADPGTQAGAIVFQEADSDVDGDYITPSAAAYTLPTAAGTLVYRVDLIPTGGRFMRPKWAARANAVGIVIKATALA